MASCTTRPFLYKPRHIQVRPYKEFCSYISNKTGDEIGEDKFSITNPLYPGAVYLSHIKINDEHRRKGYATKLLSSLIQSFKDQGKTSFVTNVASNNEKSIGLFIKHGFTVKTKGLILTLSLELEKASKL